MLRHRRKIYEESSTELSGSALRNLKPIGVSLPFNAEKGIFNQTFTNPAQVLSNLKNLFRTQKGERIMQPEFGTDIQYYLFEKIIDENTFRENIIGEIRNSLSLWMPYVSIQNIEVNTNPTDDARFKETDHAVVVIINLFISGLNIYLPVTLGISETGNLQIT